MLRPTRATVVDFMVNTAKRTGKAQGAGFYEYPPEDKKYLWRGASKIISHRLTQN